jgi:acyl transferase domain-containing protein
MVKKHQNYLAKFPDRLRKLAYNLSERRERLKYRAFCVSNGSQLLSETAAAPCRNLNQVAFVFTGQGAQWYVFLPLFALPNLVIACPRVSLLKSVGYIWDVI